MSKYNQNGSLHVVIIGIVALVIVGAVGLLFWNNFLQPKADDKVKSDSQTVQKASPSVRPSTAVQSTTLALKDWAVQFAVSGDLQKAGVKVQKETGPTINADGTEGSYMNYNVSTQRQRDFGQLTSENANRLCDAGSPVTVIRNSTPDEPLIVAGQINGYYYRWSIPSAGGCEGPDTKAIVSALKSLKAVE